MSRFWFFAGSNAPAGWLAGMADCFASKAKPQAAILHIALEEDGRAPADMAVLIQAAEGTLFPLIDVTNPASPTLGMQQRYRPQMKPGEKWEDVIGNNFPNSVDLTRIGRLEWTISRWFGDLGDVSLKKSIEGDPDYQDPRLTIVSEERMTDQDQEFIRPVSHVVANDAVEVHRTHLRYGLIDTTKPAADTPFGVTLSKVIGGLTWKTRHEVAFQRLHDDLHCGFTLGFIGHLSLLNPDVF